jgi:mono/diheme cytochrome c family protein
MTDTQPTTPENEETTMNKATPMMPLTAALAIAIASGACKDKEPEAVPAAKVEAKVEAKLDSKAEIARGRYMVNAGACHDCHTPLKMGPDGPAPDMSRALSGHPASLQMPPAPQLPPGPWLVSASATNTAWAGPWGVSFTANLTPDPETGTGSWTRQNFIDTIRNGRHMGAGRPLLPPMPAPAYANLTDEDLGAIYAYLRTIPAISNKVPAPIPPGKSVTTTAATLPAKTP